MKNAAPPLSVPPRRTGRHCITLHAGAETQLASFETDESRQSVSRILVLKLDHLGDFLIGLPALKQLRDLFLRAKITLVCGPWNVATAEAAAVADEIRPFAYFPENAQDWDGQIAKEALNRFRAVCAGPFDLAIDLRVDEDTRPLLRDVEAQLRCGIGSRQTHPYLDITLPREFERRETAQPGGSGLVIRPDGFHSRMVTQTPFFHEADFSVTNTHLLYGPYCQLPLGRLRAELAYQMMAPAFWSPQVRMTIDVVRHDRPEPVAVREVPRLPKSQLCRFDVTFVNDAPDARYEIRTFVAGRPWWARLRFFGMRLDVLEIPAARFRPAELHIGESLSLLVRLIAERVRPLYAPNLTDRPAAARGIIGVGRKGASAVAKRIVVAPFSNSLLRNWPLDRYARLVTMLISELDCEILLAGSAEQAAQLTELQQRLDQAGRVVNLAGQVDWAGLANVIGEADLVIANNSGVAHLAAACGTPTLAIYSGSHQPQEWGPRGRFVRALMAAVPCSPCGHDKLEDCPNDHLCMTSIEPETVFAHAREILARSSDRPVCADTSVEKA